MHERYGTDQSFLSEFYPVTTVKRRRDEPSTKFAKDLAGKIAVGDIVDLKTGEVLVASGAEISEDRRRGHRRFGSEGSERARIVASAPPADCAEMLKADGRDLTDDPIILQSLREDDQVKSHEEALLKIYGRLRPGNPPQIEKARRALPREVLRCPALPPRPRRPLPPQPQVRHDDPRGPSRRSSPKTSSSCIKYILEAARRTQGEIDDIDHLGNRRVRTIARARGRRVPQGLPQAPPHRAGAHEPRSAEKLTPRNLINSKTISSRDRLLLRPRRALAGRRPDEPALASSRTSGVSRRSGPAA